MNQHSLSHPVKEHEAARLLCVAVQTMRNWRHQGRGPNYCKIGTRVSYLIEDLKLYREERRIVPEGNTHTE